ncbi:MAG: LamG-like jellyroll fold domain-containing protein [Planctomycetota bacterium]
MTRPRYAHPLLLVSLALGCSVLFWTSAPAQCVRWTHLSTAAGDLEAPTVNGEQQTNSLIVDIDLDGVNDFVISERRSTPSLVWYRRNADGWTRFVIDDTLQPIEAGGSFHDVDGDGDTDLVLGADSSSNQMWWWENPYPSFGSPWTRRLIKSVGQNQHHDLIFGDFDGDGVVELVFWNQGDNNSLKIAEIPADPRTFVGDWPYTTIFTAGSISEGLDSADVDGDGLLDVVGGGYWFKFVGGGSFTPMPIDPGQGFSRAAVGQLIPGGYPEVVFVVGDVFGPEGIDGFGPLQWYEYDGTTWVSHLLLGFDVQNGHSLDVVDIDDDGNLDIFCAEMRLSGGNTDAKVWVFYGDGAGGFETTEVATGFDSHESHVGDLDGDGDLDIIGKPFDTGVPGFNIWINNRLEIDQWARHPVDVTMPERAVFVTGADIDGDGDLDVVGGGWWWENPGTLNIAWTRHTVGAPMNQMAWVHDIDGDGDPDLLGTDGEFRGDGMSWAENAGDGTFSVHPIGSAGVGSDFWLQGATGARLSPGDDYKICLSWQSGAGGVQAYTIPNDPVNDPWMLEVLHPSSQGEDLTPVDLDFDGDLDIFQGTQWLRNEGSSWTAFTASSITSFGTPDRSRLVDMDGDGDLDAVVGFAHYLGDFTSLVWFESPADPTQTWTIHTIDDMVGGGWSVDVADLDGDHDFDVVLGEHMGQHRLIAYENQGAGASWTPFVIDTGDTGIDHHDSAILLDVDADGDLDIVSTGWEVWRLHIYENKSIDCNPDLLAPTVPEQLVGIAVSGTRVALAWDPSTDDVAVAGYRVARDGQVVATVVANQYLDTALFPMVQYSYTVSAVDEAGNVSAPSVPVVVSTAAAQPVPDPTLFAGYGFEERSGSTTLDGSSNAHHGTLAAGASRELFGYFGRGVSFDGVSGHVDLGGLDIAGTGLTVMLWCKPEAFGIADARLISKASGVAEDDHYWMLSTNNGTGIRVRLKAGSNTKTLVAAGAQLAVGTWAHIALTYDGSTIAVYQNGVLVGSAAKTGGLGTNPAVSVWVGDNPGGGKTFDGIIDEVRLYDRALAASEIQSVANAPLVALEGDTNPPTQPTGLGGLALAHDRVRVFWNAASDDVAVEGYRIFRDGAFLTSVLGVTEFFDQNLAADTNYAYAVAAFDDAGNASAVTPTITVHTDVLDLTAPSAPPGFMAVASSRSTVSLTWSAATDDVGVVAYRVRRDGVLVGTTRGTGSSFIDSGLAPSSAYTYEVIAEDAAGNESSAATASATTLASTLSPDVLAAFGFDELAGTLAFDASGNGYHSSLSPGASRTVAQLGRALDFNGFIGYVDLGNLDIPSSELTIAMWCRPDDFDDPFQRLISKANGTTEQDHWWMLSTYVDRSLRFRLKTSGGVTETAISAPAMLTAGVWTHVAATYDGSSMRIYRNGVLVASEGHTGAIAVDPGVFARIGDNPTSGAAFDGVIDEVWILTRALAAAEIATLMTTPIAAAPSGDTSPPSRPTGVLATAMSATEVLVDWNASADNVAVAGYRVSRDGFVVATTAAAVTQYSDVGLASGVTYSYEVSAFDAAGNVSPPSTPPAVVTTPTLMDTTAPTPPSAVMATAVSPAEVALVWSPSTDDVGVTVYQVRRGGATVATVPATLTAFQDLSVSAGVTYSYTIVAFDAAGNVSAPSQPAEVTTPLLDETPPSIPSPVVATALSANAIRLTWGAAVDDVGVDIYLVRRDGMIVASLPGAALEYTAIGLAPATAYTFTVAALDAAGNASGESLPATATTLPVTAGPMAFAAYGFEGLGATIVDASGNGHDGVLVPGASRNAAGVFGSAVEFSGVSGYVSLGAPELSGGQLTLAAWIKPDDFGAKDARIISKAVASSVNDHYWMLSTIGEGMLRFRVKALGSPTQTLNSTGPQLQAGVWTHVAGTYDGTTMRLYQDGVLVGSVAYSGAINPGPGVEAWIGDNPGPSRKRFDGLIDEVWIIEDALDAGEIAVLMSTPVVAPGGGDSQAPTVPAGVQALATSATSVEVSWLAATDNVAIAGYSVLRDGVLLTTTGPLDTLTNDATVVPLSTYSYTVIAFDAAGNDSAPSSPPAVVQTPGVPDSESPTAPVLVAVATSETSVQLDWSAATDNVAVTGYRVRRDGAVIANVAGGVLALLDTGGPLQTGATFAYTVAAFDMAGNETPSIPALVTMPDLTPPLAPTNLVGVVVSATAITLTWSAATDNVGVTGYQVVRDGTVVASLGSAQTTFADLGLTPSTSYPYTVAAFDAAGNTSAPSAPVVVQTPAAADTAAPTVPGSVTALALSTTSVRITWAPATDNVAVSEYRVFRDGLAVATLGSTVLQFVDFGLVESTTYDYNVSAADAAGNVSALSVTASATTHTPVPLDPSLIVAFGFEDGAGSTVLDSSGNDNDGVLRGATRVPGVFGDAMRGDGVEGSVDLGTLDLPATSELTIALWCRPDSFSIPDARFVSKAVGYELADQYWTFSTHLGNQLRFRLRNGTNVKTLTVASSLTTGVWTHIAAVYNGSSMRIYQDGVQLASTGRTGAVGRNPAARVAIGDAPGGGRAFAGAIDDVRIYTRALAPAELVDLMGQPLGAPPTDGRAPTVPADVVAYAASTTRIDLHWTASTDSRGVADYVVLRDGAVVGTTVETLFADEGLVAATPFAYEVLARDAAGNVSAPSAAVSATTLASDGDEWLGASWGFRVPLVVDPQSYRRFEKPIELDVDFTGLLSDLGTSGALDVGSIRVVEVNAAGQILDASVPHQFDLDPTFEATANARGRLVFLAEGWQPGTARRYYHLYFAVNSALPPAAVTPRIVVTDNVIDEGMSSYQVATTLGTFHYQKDAGGFSSAVDLDGNDWISHAPTGGAGGLFRGIPNLVSPENHFHPGYSGSSSSLVRQGPLLTEIHTETLDGAWECTWEIFPRYARLTVLRADHPYWFLYQGTPGGRLDVLTDYCLRADGTFNFLTTPWGGDLAGEEWVLFADPLVGRALFFANHEDDSALDAYDHQNELMTDFGFGRDTLVPILTIEPAQFTFGFIEDPEGSGAAAEVRAAYRPIAVDRGAVVTQAMVTVAPSTPDGVAASALSDHEIRLTWNAATDNVAIAGYRLVRDGVLLATVGADTSYTDAGLAPATPYTYQVIAIDAQGNASAASTAVQATTF